MPRFSARRIPSRLPVHRGPGPLAPEYVVLTMAVPNFARLAGDQPGALGECSGVGGWLSARDVGVIPIRESHDLGTSKIGEPLHEDRLRHHPPQPQFPGERSQLDFGPFTRRRLKHR